MLNIRPLADNYAISAQIRPDDVAAIKAAGFDLIVNNRPDGEGPLQPAGADIAAAAAAAGVDYRALPMRGVTVEADDQTWLGAQLAAGCHVLAFCASGARSTILWALLQAGEGVPAAQLIAQAAQAGQNLQPLSPILDRLAGR